MKPKFRYALVTAGIIGFLIIAPLIYLFVTGTRYNFATHRFVKTGILAANTDPSGAEIFLNGKPYGATPAKIRFLDPGNYDIRISKSGYFDWRKHLQIQAQYVTYANAGLKNLVMFFSNPSRTEIAGGVLNFFAGNNRLVFLTKGEINIADVGSPDSASQIALPQNFSSGSGSKIKASGDENYFLISSGTQYLLLDAQQKTAIDISPLMAGILSAPSAVQFSGSDSLYALEGNALYSIDWRDKSKTKVLSGVSAYKTSGGAIYYLSAAPADSASPEGLALSRAQLPSFASMALVQNLPAWENARIFVSPQNQIFIIGDGSLYAVSQNLRHLADFVRTVQIQNANSMLYATNNEIDLYDPATQAVAFVTRSIEPISYPNASPGLGWVFYISKGKIRAIETDNRDTQNNYAFAAAGGLDAKYFISADAKTIFYLNNGDLAELKIRQ